MDLKKIKHKNACVMIFILGLLFMVSAANAKMFVNTELASGKITDIKDGVIELDGDKKYQPANNEIEVSINTGSKVTIRYIITPDGTKKYIEVAPGLNALSPQNMPLDDSSKKRF